MCVRVKVVLKVAEALGGDPSSLAGAFVVDSFRLIAVFRRRSCEVTDAARPHTLWRADPYAAVLRSWFRWQGRVRGGGGPLLLSSSIYGRLMPLRIALADVLLRLRVVELSFAVKSGSRSCAPTLSPTEVDPGEPNPFPNTERRIRWRVHTDLSRWRVASHSSQLENSRVEYG